MKNSAAVIKATNEKVKVRKQSHIPNDLFFFVLSKLPIKSLKRFGCVRKSWSLLFDNLYFMTMYRNSFLTKNHPYYDNTSVLLHQTFRTYLQEPEPYQLQTLSGERFENRVKLDWPSVKLDPINLHKEEYDSGFNIIGSGSVHGNICLLCASQENIILWNPSTKEFKLIPPSPFDSEPYWGALIDHGSFGYHRVRDDYKVMCHGQVIQEYNNYGIYEGPYIWEIYSLRSNSWRKINVDVENNHMDCEQVYLDGLAHWMCSHERRNEAYLLSFDWNNKVFLTTPIPSYMNYYYFQKYSPLVDLVLLNGSVALILNDIDTSTLHISIIGEVGAKESWIKLFIVESLPCLSYPIGAGKKGDMLFKKEDGGLVWFNLNTQTIQDLGIIEGRFYKIVIHKESFHPFEGANA